MTIHEKCLISDCKWTQKALGLCGTDYGRYRRGQLPDYVPPTPNHKPYKNAKPAGQVCGFGGCGRPPESLGLCNTHGEQRRRGGPLTPILVPRAARGCKEPECPKPHEAHGYCTTHYAYAIGRAEVAVGGRAPVTNKEGYVRLFIPGHPCAQKTGYALESHVVMTAVLGRPVLPGETVHHVNGVKTDNRPENLELWVGRHGKGQRVEDMVAWAKDLLRRYEPGALAEHD